MSTDNCIKWGEEKEKTCAEYRDDGYSACSDWESECCDWWPCSWACKVLSWFCVAWYWISNVVCVAWTYVTKAVCLIWEAVATMISVVGVIIEKTIGVILDVIGFIIELIFSIPILGAFLRELWTVITDVFWRFVGVIDGLGWIVGIRPEKKVFINIMILRDEKGNLVAEKKIVLKQIQRLIEIFRDQSNVRVLPLRYFDKDTLSPFINTDEASEDWIIELTTDESAGILDVDCGASAIGQDYWTQGAKFNWLMATKGFWGNGRRLVGYGAPIAVFVVRSITDAKGCSLNVLSDYICIEPIPKKDFASMAHECSHSCGLWEVDSPKNNLMYNKDVEYRDLLNDVQTIMIRDSKHVIYF
jgi:hypothetical protein